VVQGSAPPSLSLGGPSLADEQREVARARIVRAAGGVLAARGLAATVDDVAEAAGVSRRTIFRHFATRDALFVTVIRAGIRRYAEQIPVPPAGADLRAWLPELLAVTHRLNAGNGPTLARRRWGAKWSSGSSATQRGRRASAASSSKAGANWLASATPVNWSSVSHLLRASVTAPSSRSTPPLHRAQE
jgi:AcrR family transcriptional regulator